jgi:hypothetical protein
MLGSAGGKAFPFFNFNLNFLFFFLLIFFLGLLILMYHFYVFNQILVILVNPWLILMVKA